MKNLKESLKLIFTAVVNLLMSLVPGRKGTGEAAEGYVTGRKGCGRSVSEAVSAAEHAAGAPETVSKVSLYGRNKVEREQLLKWKIYQYKPKEMRTSPVSCGAQKGQAYADTG